MNALLSTAKPFVVIAPYQFDGDVAFGVWGMLPECYVLGDGDAYTVEQLQRIWPNAKLLTWSELETLLGARR